jgi:hypothetical protein
VDVLRPFAFPILEQTDVKRVTDARLDPFVGRCLVFGDDAWLVRSCCAQTYPQTCVATICVGDSLFLKKLRPNS